MEAKTPSCSVTEHFYRLEHKHLNGKDCLFGGILLQWIDTIAGVVAVRHCGGEAVTAGIDNLSFIASAKKNDLVVLRGKATYTGNTSLEVKVDTYIESFDGSRRLINSAYINMVAIDEYARPMPLPPLLPETDEEKSEFAGGKKRSALRKLRKKEGY